jgi:hypothetical protein
MSLADIAAFFGGAFIGTLVTFGIFYLGLQSRRMWPGDE